MLPVRLSGICTLDVFGEVFCFRFCMSKIRNAVLLALHTECFVNSYIKQVLLSFRKKNIVI